MKTINARIKQIIDELFDGNIKEFSDKIDINYHTIRNIIGERQTTPSSLVLENIVNALDTINPMWLISGKDSMIQAQKEKNATPILCPNVMMVPLVSQYAQAGYLSGFSDTDYMEALPRIPVMADHESKGDYVAFEVRGESMDNETDESLKEGDILICRNVKREYWKYKLHINKWDFVIVHRTEGILVKRIIDHDVENAKITLHSLNPMYSDFVLNLNDVAELFNVVQVSRTRRR